MPRTNPAQLAFAFAEPVLPWLAAPAVVPVRAVALPAPTVDARGVIDFRLAVDMLRHDPRYDEGHDGVAACTRDLAAWHGGDPNDHGIYVGVDEVEVACDGDASATAHLAVTGRGRWLCGYRLRCGTAGAAGPASVWAASGGLTREAALGDMARRFAPWFAGEAVSTDSVVAAKTKRHAAVLAERLRAYGQRAALEAVSRAA